MGKNNDKVALITGGSSGIGFGVAQKLATLGYQVVISGKSLAKLESAEKLFSSESKPPFILSCDVSEELQVEQLVKKTVLEFGKIDFIFAAAGISMRAPFEDSKITAIEKLFQINFFGVLYLLHHSLPLLKQSKGSFVAMSSLTGKRGVPEYSVYGASKFALQGLLDSVRLEVARKGVHIGIVATGFVDTPLRNQVLGGDGEILKTAPALPFRLWPLEKCVNMVIDLMLKRKREALLPWFMRALFTIDVMNNGKMGDRFLKGKFGYSEE